MKKPIQAVLFDLDGTLLDTSIDLSSALNRVLTARKLQPLAHAETRPIVGKGCKGMLKLGLNIEEHHPEYPDLCKELLDYYLEHVCETTQFFPGVEVVLQHLEKNNIPWGIVTNKPAHLTALLVEQLALHKRTPCIVSGDTLSKAKPHPEPLLHACKLLQQEPDACLYVGDAEIDIIASKAAGIPVLAALYGFIAADEDPLAWKADGYIQHPEEIIGWLS